VSPGHALNGGRLVGAIWPIPATQVAHYAAVTLGLTVVLWFCGQRRGKPTLVAATVTVIILLLTHTRTALVAVILGLLIAGLSLVVTESRVRKLFAYTAAVVAVAGVTASSFITSYLDRGQGTQQLTSLTGRTNFWGAVLAYPRNWFQEMFGFGLSNGQFNGLPIDSNWLESYQEQGLFGVAVCAVILVFLIVTAYFQPRGVQRALALFLVTYCLVASFTEVGFADVTPYLLDVTVAASLLVPSIAAKRPA
jgi:O-antigen ligase